MDVLLREAGESEAGRQIKECIAAAADQISKKACMTSGAAKLAFAKASGKQASSIRDTDLKEAAKDQGRKDARDTWKACMDSAADATAQKACSTSDELKRAIADSESGDSDIVRDSKVREYITEEGKKEQLTFIKSCDKSDASKCKEMMKEMKAKESGKDISQISDDQLRKDIKEALPADVAERMRACVEDASKDQAALPADVADKLKACRTSIANAVKEADLDGKIPNDAEVQRVLKESATNVAKTVMQNCDKSRTECMDLARERSAAALGKADGKAAVSTRVAEVMNKKGADQAAKDSVKACVQAKKDDPDATCDDAYEKFLETRQKTKPTSRAARTTEKAQVMVNAQKEALKDSLKICTDRTTKEEVTACMEQFKTENDDLAKAAFGDADAQKLEAKKKQSDREATIEHLGEQLEACIEVAVDETAKTACKTEMSQAKDKLGSTESDEAVMKKYNAKKIAEAAQVCESALRKDCLADAKEEFERTGNKAREFDHQKKMGEVKVAADAWVACSQEGLTDSTCDDQAKAVFMEVSGTDGSTWADEVLPKVQKLGQGLRDGEDVVMKKKKQLSVDTLTDGTSCQDSVGNEVVSAIKAMDATLGLAISGAKAKGCRKEDGVASYSAAVGTADMNEAQTETAADIIATTLATTSLSGGRRLRERRLVSVTGVGAAVDTELCAAGDSTCGQTDPDWAKPTTTKAVTTTKGDTTRPGMTSGTTKMPATLGVSSSAVHVAIPTAVALAMLTLTA